MSDQDFFFDEDDQPKKDAPKSGGVKKGSGSSRTAAAAPAGAEQSVSVTVTALVAVVAVLLGVIIGIFVGRGLATPSVPGVGSGATIEGGGATEAPQLTPEQLEGGALPEGHPDIGGGAGGAATGTAPAEGATDTE